MKACLFQPLTKLKWNREVCDSYILKWGVRVSVSICSNFCPVPPMQQIPTISHSYVLHHSSLYFLVWILPTRFYTFVFNISSVQKAVRLKTESLVPSKCHSIQFQPLVPVLFLAAILDMVLFLVFWTQMHFSVSQILVISVSDSFSPALVDEISNRF